MTFTIRDAPDSVRELYGSEGSSLRIDFKFLKTIFTRRNESQLDSLKPLTPEFRYRVRQLCVDTLTQLPIGLIDDIEPFWVAVHKKLIFHEGRSITSHHYLGNDARIVDEYLIGCDDGRFLDFIELIFQTTIVNRNSGSWHSKDRVRFIESINEFLLLDDLPYAITQYDYPTYPNTVSTIVGTGGYSSGILQYPRVILRENDVIHSSAVEPALTLLSNSKFSSANTEFLEALKHYRKGEYGDCLTKCGSAMESTMKIICHEKDWNYKQTDTFSPLLDIVFQETSLESFLKQPIMQVGTLRNKISTSHGAGVQNKNVPKYKAQFAINSSASAIILLITESGLDT